MGDIFLDRAGRRYLYTIRVFRISLQILGALDLEHPVLPRHLTISPFEARVYRCALFKIVDGRTLSVLEVIANVPIIPVVLLSTITSNFALILDGPLPVI